MEPVFLVDRDDPGGTEKPGEVSRSGGRMFPSGVQAPGAEPWGQSPQKLNRFVWF